MPDPRRTLSETVPAVAMGLALFVAALLALGMPDLGLAGQFLSGAYPTIASAVAVCSIICYAVVLAASVVAIAGVVHGQPRRRSTLRALRAVAFALAGAALLGLSLTTRLEVGQALCCGSGPPQIQEAASLVR